MYLDIYAASERWAKVHTSSCADICNSGDNEASDICIWDVTKLVSLIGPRPHNMDCDPQYGWRRMDLWYMDLELGRRVTTLFNLMTKYFSAKQTYEVTYIYFITTISTAGAHRPNIYSTINVASTWRRGPAFCVARDAEQLLFIYCAGLRLESLHSPPTVTTQLCPAAVSPCTVPSWSGPRLT